MKKIPVLFCSLYLISVISIAQIVDITVSSPACFGELTYLEGTSDSSATVASWKWDLDNDGAYDDAIGNETYYSFDQAGTYTVGLKVILYSGYADSTSKPAVVNPLPEVNFQVDNLCEGKPAVYMDNSTVQSGSIVQYKWDFNNDGVVDNNSGPVVSYTCGPAQTYITKLECVTDAGCSSFTTKTTEVDRKSGV